jgi:hypothetical protein
MRNSSSGRLHPAHYLISGPHMKCAVPWSQAVCSVLLYAAYAELHHAACTRASSRVYRRRSVFTPANRFRHSAEPSSNAEIEQLVPVPWPSIPLRALAACTHSTGTASQAGRHTTTQPCAGVRAAAETAFAAAQLEGARGQTRARAHAAAVSHARHAPWVDSPHAPRARSGCG